MGDTQGASWALSPATIVHIGEEVADVLVYSVRLADLCSIDLAAAISAAAAKTPEGSHDWVKVVDSAATKWTDRALDTHTSFSTASTTSSTTSSATATAVSKCDSSDIDVLRIRSMLFRIQSHLGTLCSVFSQDGLHVLENFRLRDKIQVARSLAQIVLSLSLVCESVGILLSSSVTDKIIKNRKKYPKDMVKGSSAKYTEYQNKNRNEVGESLFNNQYLAIAAGVTSFAIIVRFLLHK
jgi:hypothetical protein